MQDKGRNENFHLYVSDIDGRNLKDLTPFDGTTLGMIKLIKDTDFVVVSMNKNNKQIFEPYKINFVTGEITQLFENKDVKSLTNDYIFDKEGNLRGYTILENGLITKTYYKDLQVGKFNLVKSTDWYNTFRILKFNDNSNNRDEAYVVTNLDSDKERIVIYDLKKNAMIKEVYSNPVYSVSSINVAGKNRKYELDFISYSGIKGETVPISKLTIN